MYQYCKWSKTTQNFLLVDVGIKRVRKPNLIASIKKNIDNIIEESKKYKFLM